jgi:hypothetical protein
MPDHSEMTLVDELHETGDADTVEAFNEDTHHMAVSFFFDDGAMDYSNEPMDHACEWRCVVRVPTRYGYMEVPFNVSPALAGALEAVVAEAAKP